MKALTICQPYAELILREEKLIENRRWSTTYRGQLLIHAGKSRKWFEGVTDAGWPLPEECDFGAIVGWVNLIACATRGSLSYRFIELHHQQAHAEGPFYWVLKDAVRLVDPVPWRGNLGLFDVPESVLEKKAVGK